MRNVERRTQFSTEVCSGELKLMVRALVPQLLFGMGRLSSSGRNEARKTVFVNAGLANSDLRTRCFALMTQQDFEVAF
jgi:hypothetical protein